ncbi:MAG: hypothetical protein NTV86_15625 [Planctomycetota bacterium]|nr:hypothetical protein [Planctomycetota bacterium]
MTAQLVVRILLTDMSVEPMIEDGGDPPHGPPGGGVRGQEKLRRRTPPVVIERMPLAIQHEVLERAEGQHGEGLAGVQSSGQLPELPHVRLGLHNPYLAAGGGFFIQGHRELPGNPSGDGLSSRVLRCHRAHRFRTLSQVHP